MEHLVTRLEIEAAAQYVREHTRHQPEFGIVLGSGLAALAEAVEDADFIPFHEIPNFPGLVGAGPCGAVGHREVGRPIGIGDAGPGALLRRLFDVAGHAADPHDAACWAFTR